MAIQSRRYKLIGYDATQPANGITSWGAIVDTLGLPYTLRRTIQFDDTQTTAGDVDFLALQQGWQYDP